MSENEMSDKDYEYLVNLIESLYAFHPEYFAELSSDDRDVLSQYFFAERKVDVDSVFDYRRQLLQEDPDIEARAEAAWRRFREVAKM